jgi:hypothetical protein
MRKAALAHSQMQICNTVKRLRNRAPMSFASTTTTPADLLNEIALAEHTAVILDGICREIACVMAGVEPSYRKIKVNDACAYWISMNDMRTHLNEFQRAMGEAVLAQPDDDEACDPDQLPPPVVAARYVRAHAPEYVDAVIQGYMGLYRAYDLAVEGQHKHH